MNISSNSRSKDALNSFHTLLNANNVESCKKLIDDLSLLQAVQADKADFCKLAKDDLGTSLIPDIDLRTMKKISCVHDHQKNEEKNISEKNGD